MGTPANKRNYKKEYADYHGKPEQVKQRAERVKAQRMVDKTGKDENGNGKADAREGKDIDLTAYLRYYYSVNSQIYSMMESIWEFHYILLKLLGYRH